MNIVNSTRSAACAAILALSGLAACDSHHDAVRQGVAPDASAVVIGTAPAAPTGDPPGTIAVDPGTTDVAALPQHVATPLPGQANDHSNLSSAPSQRAGTSQANPASDAAAASADGSSKKGP
jgi:hypothetical protein